MLRRWSALWSWVERAALLRVVGGVCEPRVSVDPSVATLFPPEGVPPPPIFVIQEVSKPENAYWVRNEKDQPWGWVDEEQADALQQQHPGWLIIR